MKRTLLLSALLAASPALGAAQSKTQRLTITLPFPEFAGKELTTSERMPSGARNVNLAIGSSVPATDPDKGIKSIVTAPGGGPSRRSGGEVVGFGFFNAKNKKELKLSITKVRVMGFSKSGKGKVLMHNVGTVPETARWIYEPLLKYAKLDQDSRAENHNGKVMLREGDWATVTPEKPLNVSRMLFTIEGFSHNDGSLNIQLETSFEDGTVAVGFGRALVNPPEDPVDPPSDPGPGNPPREEPKPEEPKPVHKQCDKDSDCPGFANSCFAGRCTQPGFQCEKDSDCPGFANSCFAGKCTKQEALCDSDKDCPGFANSCFAGKCTNP